MNDEKSSLQNIHIKKEIPSDEDFTCKELLKGRIVDYQFLVLPKKEVDVKHELNPLDLKGEILSSVYIDNYLDNVNSTNYGDDEDLKSLVTRKKLSPTLYNCKHCDFSSKYKKNVKRHQSIHKRKETLNCEKCSYTCINRFYLNQHTLANHHEDVRIYQCHLCDFKSKIKYYVDRHFKSMHQTKPKNLVCNICGYSTHKISCLKDHATTHSENRNFSCDLCSYKARTKSNLQSHKEYIHSEKPRPSKATCEICGKMFTSKHFLNPHLVNVHKVDLEVRTYICYHCGFKNLNRSHFTSHVLRHSKNHVMYCANCKYKTHNKTNLIQHMVKHMKCAKMYKCHICSFETKRPHTLRNHVKTHKENY